MIWNVFTPAIDRWLAQLFDNDRLGETCAALEKAAWPDIAEQNRLAAACKKLKEGDHNPAKYRQALEAVTNPAIVGGWIEEVKLARKAAVVARRPPGDGARPTAGEIMTLIGQLKGIVIVLNNAAPRTAGRSTGS